MQIQYEPFSEDARRDPYPFYRQLREHAPVHWAPEAGVWVVSRYDDVEFVLRHPEIFSSDAMGGMLSGAPASAPTPTPADGEAEPRILILMDPPAHGFLRALVNRGFTPRRIAQLEAQVRVIVERHMQKIRGAATFDLVADFAIPVPITVIAEMLGVETERIGDFRRWSDAIVAASTGSGRGDPDSGVGSPAFASSFGELMAYLGEMIELRKREPADDLISALVRKGEAIDGEQARALTPEEISAFALVMLVAGNETTTNLLGSLVRVLLDHPDQLLLVQQDRELIPALIEEALRFESPIQFLFRRTTREVLLGGITLPAGVGVLPVLASANRDERVFERADEFDVLRDRGRAGPSRGHLAFGFGVHFCLGAALARLEAQVAMEALLPELIGVRFKGRSAVAASDRIDSFMLRGLSRLELERCA